LNPGAPLPQPPIASFTYTPTYPEVNQIVTFDASASYDPDGNIVSYTWDFGDGTPPVTENDPIIYHAYASYGDYIVKLTVTDNSSLTDDETASIHVSQHPVASFTFTPPDPLVHELVTFDASASTPDGGTIISYTWNFGDGTPIVETDQPVITHVYAETSDYLVTLNVTDSEGRWDTETHTITVVPKRYYLKVKTDPEGVTTIPGENWYSEGTQVTLTAPDPVPVSTGVRYKFLYWDVDGTQVAGNPITVVMDANHTATAPL
jgi:PKD repeat protein